MQDSIKKEEFKVSFGSWYQRTTLHLTEVYNLFAFGTSALSLAKEKLAKFKIDLDLKKVSREVGYLEHIRARTNNGIEIRYYEDGLYILEIASTDVDAAKQKLADYHEQKMGPAISYIFSLGAPTPKVLANIKTVHPTAITLINDEPQNFQIDSGFGEVYNRISSPDLSVYKTPDYIFVVAKPSHEEVTRVLVETQIFFREFKDQLQKYLDIHRKLWEEISDIKEKKSIKGTEVEILRSRLDSYQKTISLISNRINQMGSYVGTRSAISKNFEIDKYLVELFQFKFESLTDTLNYIKEIWKMTTDYLTAAIVNITEIKNQGAAKGHPVFAVDYEHRRGGGDYRLFIQERIA